MILSMIVAMSENDVIGRDMDLPWRLSEDLKRFKKRTLNHTLIMGRKTFESIGKPLPKRRSIIITRNEEYTVDGAEVYLSLEDAIAACCDEEEVFIAGGGHVYAQCIERADRMYVTQVHTQVVGDTYFPQFNEIKWEIIEEEEFPADEKNEYSCTFYTYQRKRDIHCYA